MSNFAGIRPNWKKLLGKRSGGTDYSVSPVREVADDVETDSPTEPPTPVAQPLVTGITAEYPTSEIIYTVEGDLVVAVSS